MATLYFIELDQKSKITFFFCKIKMRISVESYYICGSVTLSLHLSHGQSVWIQPWNSEDTFSDWISFSGALVQPDV